MSYIIFTDLDGTLLDHNTYSFKQANDALEKAKQISRKKITAAKQKVREQEESQTQLLQRTKDRIESRKLEIKENSLQ